MFSFITGNEEFFITSSNRPFQFQAGESKYVSQFFPGANAAILLSDDIDETDSCRQQPAQQNNVDFANEYEQHQYQLGELRHTRDRLKLNLVSSNGASSASFVSTKKPHVDGQQADIEENDELPELVENTAQDQRIQSSPMNDNTLPKVPHEDDVQLGPSSRILQCDNQETFKSTDK